MTSSGPRNAFAMIPLCFGLHACGGNESEGDSRGSRSSGGKAAEAADVEILSTPGTGNWEKYCEATFTQTFAVDGGEGALFTAQEGDTFLITSNQYRSQKGEEELDAQDLLITNDTGVFEFTVRFDATEPPFETNCGRPIYQEHQQVHMVVDEVTIYEDEELSTVLCTLRSGTSFEGGAPLVPLIRHTSGEGTLLGLDFEDTELPCGDASEGYAFFGLTTVDGAPVFPSMPIVTFYLL